MNTLNLFNSYNSTKLKCPTCGLKFHDQMHCRRCNTDLTFLMKTASCAWKLRDHARRLILQGKYQDAYNLVCKAQKIHNTPYGELILKFTVHATQK